LQCLFDLKRFEAASEYRCRVSMYSIRKEKEKNLVIFRFNTEICFDQVNCDCTYVCMYIRDWSKFMQYYTGMLPPNQCACFSLLIHIHSIFIHDLSFGMWFVEMIDGREFKNIPFKRDVSQGFEQQLQAFCAPASVQKSLLQSVPLHVLSLRWISGEYLVRLKARLMKMTEAYRRTTQKLKNR